jgi:hypothetical protein
MLLILILIGTWTLTFKIQPVKGPSAQVYYSVEPVAVAPLTDMNASMYGLETPCFPSPITQNFTVEIHLRNATITNVPIGVTGVEVHFYFGNILNCCRPMGFVSMLGQPGGVLLGPNILYGFDPGFYNNANDLITAPTYANATQYIVAAASTSGLWNAADGLVAKVTFQITGQPSSLLGQPDFYAQLQITFVDLADLTSSGVPVSITQGTLHIDAAGPPLHDVAITNLTSSKTVIGQGYGGNVTVSVADLGDYPETFNLTLYANTTSFVSQNVSLSSGNSATAMFAWNTAGFAFGNYTISVYAWPVPNETNTANNNCTDGNVIVSIPGDIDGDFNVSLQDLVLLANAYGSKPGDIKWNPDADLVPPWGVMSLTDLVTIAVHYGQHTP